MSGFFSEIYILVFCSKNIFYSGGAKKEVNKDRRDMKVKKGKYDSIWYFWNKKKSSRYSLTGHALFCLPVGLQKLTLKSQTMFLDTKKSQSSWKRRLLVEMTHTCVAYADASNKVRLF